MKRKEYVKNGELFDFCIPLHVDFLHTARAIPPGIQMKMKLTRSKDAFSILSGDGEQFSIKIESLTLFVYRMQASEKFLQQQDKIFSKQNALYPITRSRVKKFTIPSGLSSINTPNIVNGALPRQIVLGFVLADAVNGNYKLNPFNFQHFAAVFYT